MICECDHEHEVRYIMSTKISSLQELQLDYLRSNIRGTCIILDVGYVIGFVKEKYFFVICVASHGERGERRIDNKQVNKNIKKIKGSVGDDYIKIFCFDTM